MPNYSYQAINDNGIQITGTIEADSKDAANNALAGKGLIPTKVVEKRQPYGIHLFLNAKKHLNHVKAPDLILFTKQFKTMNSAGVPMLTLLRALENQTENRALKMIVVAITKDIKEGASLFEAFRKHSKVFSPLYCAMIRAGEASGALPQILERLTYLIEHEYQIKSNIRSALQYPLVVLSFLIVAFFILLTLVVPKFVGQFTRAGAELPLPTKITLLMYKFISGYWYLFLLFTILAGIGIVAFLRTPQGRYLKDHYLMQLPLVGPLFVKAAMSRFASIFSILQQSGIAVLDAMRILTDTISNTAISKEFEYITERLEEGRGISVPLRSAKYFTPIVINMVAIGEDAGNLEQMLHEISQHYDSEMEYGMKKLSDAVGPILTIGLAVVIGFFALAIYLPMWNLTRLAQ